MLENELITLWQSSPKHERLKFEKSKLMVEVQSSLNQFDKTTRLWDFGTIISAASMILVFAYQVYRLPNHITKFGAILIIGWCFFLIYKVTKIKKTRPHETSSYINYLKQNKEYLKSQMGLSHKFMTLVVLPCFSGVILIMIGQLDLVNKSWNEIVGSKTFWIQLFIFAVVGTFAFYMNRWVAKKEFLPRLKKVDELLQLLKKE